MPHLGRRIAAGFVVLAVLCALWIPSASAHSSRSLGESAPPVLDARTGAAPLSPADGPVANQFTEPPTAATVVLVATLLAALLLGVGAVRAPVTTIRVLLGLLVTVTAVESALHSVHHLDNPRGAKECQVLTVTQQLHGEASPELPSGVPVNELLSVVVSAVSHEPAQAVRRPDQGRAPPLPLA